MASNPVQVSLKVKNVMTKNVISLPADSPIMKACALMVVKEIRRIPVIDDKTNKLVGIVSQSDVFHALLKKATLIVDICLEEHNRA